jgi:hypothetical protein
VPLYIVYDIARGHHRQNMPIMNIVWPITAWYLGPLALWTYWHIGHLNLNLVSQNRTDSTRATNVALDAETDNVPHHIVGTRAKMGILNHSGRQYLSQQLIAALAVLLET